MFFWKLHAWFFVGKVLKEIQEIKSEGNFCIKFSNDEIPSFLAADNRCLGPITIFSPRRIWVCEKIQKRLSCKNVQFLVSMSGTVSLVIEV